MIKRVAFTMYPVKDMDRARNFYELKLGLNLGKNYQDKWIEYDLVEGGCLALTTMAEGVLPNANAGGSVAFEVDDLEEFLNKLKEDGVSIKLDLFSTPNCKMAVIIDSEGNALTLHEKNKDA